MLEPFTKASFDRCHGDGFRLQFEARDPIVLTLVDVASLRSPTDHREPFSLVFQGPLDLYLPQQIYHLQHHTLGPLALFLVPLGPTTDGMRYEAVFA